MDTNSSLQKGITLVSLGKYGEAEREFRAYLAGSPDASLGHAYLAEALAHLGKHKDAEKEAGVAIGLDPENAFCHYVLAVCYVQADKSDKAEIPLKEALRLEPQDADYLNFLAAMQYDKEEYAAALETVEKALALEPENPEFMNLRSETLTMLGRENEGLEGAGAALSREASNSSSHAAMGKAALRSGDYGKAIEAYKEALRLDPESENAKAGMVAVLKSKYWFYRWLLKYTFWISKFRPRDRAALLVGLYFVVKLYPPLAIGYLPFIYSTWVGNDLANFLLSFSKYGRLSLSEDEKWAGWSIGTSTSLMCVFVVAGFLKFSFFYLAGYFLLANFLLGIIFRSRNGYPRTILTAYSVAIALLGILWCVAGVKNSAATENYGWAYFLGCLMPAWLPNLTVFRRWFND